MEQRKSSFAELINGERPVLVDFFATWCGPCKTMSPIIDRFKHAIGDKAIVLKVDIDRNPSAAQAYRVQGVPTLIVFKQGKPVWRKAGVVSETELTTAVGPFL
jgi:thioredoxin 1